MNNRTVQVLLGGLLALSGCRGVAPVALSPLGIVTRIEVHDEGKLVGTISGRQQIDRIVAFVNQRAEGWETPWYGIPVPTITAQFFSETQLIGRFGSGNLFFECNRNGAFYSRSATRAEVDQFLTLLGGK